MRHPQKCNTSLFYFVNVVNYFKLSLIHLPQDLMDDALNCAKLRWFDPRS